MMISIYLGNSGEEKVYWIPKKEKNPHLLIVGTSGSGKTETIKAIVYELKKQNIPSLMIDFHNDFEELGENVLDFRNTTINPLDFSGGETAETTMYKVSHILRKIFSLGVQQQGALEDAIRKAYRDKGISIKDIGHSGTLPTFDNIKKNLELRMYDLQEERRSSGVIETLLVRLRPLFDTGFFSEKETASFEKIFKETTVLKLRDLPTDEVKYAVAEFFLNKLKYALYSKGKTNRIILYCMVDEAHRLLDMRSPLNDLLRESRKYGTGVVLSSQRPSDFSETVLANIGGIISFQCRFENDARFIGKQMSIDFEEIKNLTKIGTSFVNFSSEQGYKKVKIVQLEDRVKKGELLLKKQIPVKKIETPPEKTKKPAEKKPEEEKEKKNIIKKEVIAEKPEEEITFYENISENENSSPMVWLSRGAKRLWYGLDFLTEKIVYKISVLLLALLLLFIIAGVWSAPIFMIAVLLIGFL
ncbi:MAG: ATP-binding protein [Candidatus Aenigmarchaeota archaeon]|nr:ATP-binding protein [Candidatus Aenigmarchaeota archaeon]